MYYNTFLGIAAPLKCCLHEATSQNAADCKGLSYKFC